MDTVSGADATGPRLVASLTSLSENVLLIIMEDECISRDDIISLRRTCSYLSKVARAVLFHRIRISKLWRDRDAFTSICRNPDLAHHVREVEWQEISWFPGMFSYAALSGCPPVENCCQHRDYVYDGYGDLSDSSDESYQEYLDNYLDDDYCEKYHNDDVGEIGHKLEATAAKVFWLPEVPRELLHTLPRHGHVDFGDSTKIQRQRQEAIELFRDEFQEAISKLSHLGTVISRPMPPGRLIDSGDYPIEAMLFHRRLPYLNASHRNFRTTKVPLFLLFNSFLKPRGYGHLVQSNDGLFVFLLEAMGSSARSVRRLVWEDQSFEGSYYREPCPQGFEHLHTLVMKLSNEGLEEDNPNLAANLQAATNVRNLSLELRGRPKDTETPEELEYALLQFSLETKETRWSRLHSLSLSSMPAAAETAVVHIVRSNAATLRHLYIGDSGVPLGTLKELAQIVNLNLMSFRIYEDPGVADVARFPTNTTFSFVNKESVSGDNFDFLRVACERGLTDDRTIVATDGGTAAGNDDEDEHETSNDDGADNTSGVRQMGPKWDWGCYYGDEKGVYDSGNPSIYYYQVPDSNPYGRQTTCWKFTSRDGEVAYGLEPLEYFEDWDTEAGDVEEPTPYCSELYDFAQDKPDVTLCNVTPPKGAILYDEEKANECVEARDNWTTPY